VRKTNLRFAVLACAALLLAAAPPRVPASRAPAAPRSPAPRASVPAPPPNGGASFDVGVWTVRASSVDANFKSGNFSTPNQVVMTKVGSDITADRANGNYKKKLVYLNGHVVMHDNTGSYGGISSVPAGHPSGPSTLTADRAEIDGIGRTYKAIGNVHYVQGDTVVDAQSGTLDDTTHELFLQGNVHITQGTRSISSQTLRYNTVTGQAHAQGDVTLQFPNEVKRGIATPRPINVRIPKNPIVKPEGSSPP
jgi:lipopolysaccharide assembly outer membrane protein LptD (OstA)